MFNNPALAAYTKAEDIILTVDGVCLQPTTDYTFIGSSLTVSAYLQSGSYLTVFANASSCS
jgi:hypothetical protein